MVYVGSVAEAVPRTTRWASILSSPDGINWTIRPNPMDAFGVPNLEIYFPNCVAANDSEILMGTFSGSSVNPSPNLFRSTDGVTWTAISTPYDSAGSGPSDFGSVQGLAWNGSLWCAIGTQSGTGNQIVATSPDGITWTTTATFLPSLYLAFLAIVWNGSYFVVTSIGPAYLHVLLPNSITASDGFVIASSDAITWTDQLLPHSNPDGILISPNITGNNSTTMAANISTGEVVMFFQSVTAPDMFGFRSGQVSLVSCTDIGTGSPPAWSFMTGATLPVPTGTNFGLTRTNTEWFVCSSDIFVPSVSSAYITDFNTVPSAWTQQSSPSVINVEGITAVAYSPELSQLVVIGGHSDIGVVRILPPSQIATSTDNGATWTERQSPLETESNNPNAGPGWPTDWAQDVTLECVTWSSAFSQWIVGCSQSRFARDPFGAPGRYWQP